MAEPIQVDFSGKGGGKGGKGPAVIAPERAGLRILLSAAGSVITAFVAYYVMLPPLNFKAKEFYYYIGLVLLSFVVLLALLCRGGSRPEYMPFVKKTSRIPLLLTGVLVAFFAVAWVISSPFFQAKNYSAIMEVRTESNFEEEIQEPDYASIPRLDENSAKMVANRALGDLADVVSQFTIAESTTQINYQQKPVRVVTLAYANIIKWFTNTGEGLPGYVIVDMANEKTQLVKLEKRIRYSDEEHFGHLLKRHLRFQYPTAMFGEATFEIDDEGRPFWIAPVMDKVIGLLGGEDVIGIVLVDAVTGDCTRYTIEQLRGDESLQWIDRVFSATLLGTQYNFHGKYGGGFWNSLLGQSGVTV
ncbi:MAG: CvpA family protein, partial [Oscillospiraceae bacterium]|nr:CvpA family protein [Oscillospiraceae bacterium]